MPITTWKIMLRRGGQAGYHHLKTEQKGWAPTVGERGKISVEGRSVRWTIVEVFNDHTTRAGTDVFTVRVDETEAVGGGKMTTERSS